MEEEELKPQIEQRESIKLFKNTKGYNWEIRILEINLERLAEINNRMIEAYGQ